MEVAYFFLDSTCDCMYECECEGVCVCVVSPYDFRISDFVFCIISTDVMLYTRVVRMLAYGFEFTFITSSSIQILFAVAVTMHTFQN